MRKALFTGLAEQVNKYANAQPKNRAVASKRTIELKHKEWLNQMNNCALLAICCLFSRSASRDLLFVILKCVWQKMISGLPRGMEEALNRDWGLLQV